MRLANSDDVLNLSYLRVQQQKEDWEELYMDNFNLLKRTIEYLENHLNKDIFIFVEEDKNKIIATCGLEIIESLPQCNDNGKKGYICNVYTDYKYRNKGIQTMLLKEVINFSKKKELFELTLITDSKKAINLYKKFGFKFDDLTMKLDIVE